MDPHTTNSQTDTPDWCTQADSTMTVMLFARKSWAHNKEWNTQQQGGIKGQTNKSKQQSNSQTASKQVQTGATSQTGAIQTRRLKLYLIVLI